MFSLVNNSQSTNSLSLISHLSGISPSVTKKNDIFYLLCIKTINYKLYRTSNPDECVITVLYTHEKVDSLNQELYNIQRNYYYTETFSISCGICN